MFKARYWARRVSNEQETKMPHTGTDRQDAARRGRVSQRGKSLAEVFKMLKLSEPKLNPRWNRFGGMKSKEATRLKEFEGEHPRLKRPIAEAELGMAMLKETLRGND